MERAWQGGLSFVDTLTPSLVRLIRALNLWKGTGEQRGGIASPSLAAYPSYRANGEMVAILWWVLIHHVQDAGQPTAAREIRHSMIPLLGSSK